jgi:hypothetical protein
VTFEYDSGEADPIALIHGHTLDLPTQPQEGSLTLLRPPSRRRDGQDGSQTQSPLARPG